jgi:biopolymer transport protein ExbD
MRKRSQPQIEEDAVDEPLINLTPLIDVVFVVLITFMLIAPILDVDIVDLAQSSGTVKKEPQTAMISIALHADNSIWFQGKHVSLSELERLLKQEKKRHPTAIPQLVPDKSAQFGTYQALKNALELAGFEQMDVLLKPGS